VQEVGLNYFRVMLLVVLCLTGAATQSQSRITSEQNFQELLERSDLVVIAVPVTKTADTSEVTFFSDLLQVDAKGRQTRVHATGVETRFECLAILKGGAAIEQFVLHHYRETARPTMEADGPQLVTVRSLRSL